MHPPVEFGQKILNRPSILEHHVLPLLSCRNEMQQQKGMCLSKGSSRESKTPLKPSAGLEQGQEITNVNSFGSWVPFFWAQGNCSCFVGVFEGGFIFCPLCRFLAVRHHATRPHRLFSHNVVTMVTQNGACAHYVMVSKFQWTPFWLATQRDPQKDWTATQNHRVNYDVFAQAPLDGHLDWLHFDTEWSLNN